jgi:hypothetical protein
VLAILQRQSQVSLLSLSARAVTLKMPENSRLFNDFFAGGRARPASS